MRDKTRNGIIEIVSILFIILFAYAAASKLLDYHKFRVQLSQSPLVTAFAGSVSWFIPILETGVALLLSINRFRLLALYVCFSLMSMFSFYIVAVTHYSDQVPCSCGGILQRMSWNQHLMFNIAFVIIAAVAILFYKYEPADKPQPI